MVQSPTIHHRRTQFALPSSHRTLVTIGLVLMGVQLILLKVGIRLYQNEHHQQQPTISLQQRPPNKKEKRIPDATFQGYPVYYHELDANSKDSFSSLVHCVGENYQRWTSWKHRSCYFQLFCLDLSTKEFLVWDKRQPIMPHLTKRTFLDVSQTFMRPALKTMSTVSLGGINNKWGKDGVARLEWFPTIRILDEQTKPPSSFYTLPSNVVLIPFHSLAGSNPGHFVWDDLLSIYNLLDIFQLISDTNIDPSSNYEPLLIRYVLDGSGLWASCDWTDEKREACHAIQSKFAPLIMKYPPTTRTTKNMTIGNDTNNSTTTTTTTYQSTIELTTQIHAHLSSVDGLQPLLKSSERKSDLICARHGVAGIGALTDHGTQKFHGWLESDYRTTQNHGRGRLIWKFRAFAMHNLGLSPHTPPSTRPYRIVFSEASSHNPVRNLDFAKQRWALQQLFPPDQVSIERYIFQNYSLIDQVQMASQTSIFITGCGGGAVTATFLPRGASLIVYYNEVGGQEHNIRTFKPARLDWDLLNNMAYVRVHWFPSQTMNDAEDISAFVKVVQHELGIIQRETGTGQEVPKVS